MERTPFAHMDVYEEMVIIKIGSYVRPLFNSFFRKINGRNAPNQTSQELERILRQTCRRYITKTLGPRLKGEIVIKEHLDNGLGIMVYDAYFLGSPSANSASFK
jgi:hypothetical protein